MVEDEALINRLGFNNLGAINVLNKIRTKRQIGLLGVNIGPNKETNDRNHDYVEGLKTVEVVAEYKTTKN